MEQERLACRRQDRLSLFNFDFDPTRQLHTTPDLSVLGPPPPRHLSSLEDASSGQLAATLLLGARRTLVTVIVAILGSLVTPSLDQGRLPGLIQPLALLDFGQEAPTDLLYDTTRRNPRCPSSATW